MPRCSGRRLNAQAVVFCAFAAVTFAVLYGAFRALKPPRLGEFGSIIINGQPLKLPVEPVLNLIALGLALFIAAVTGASMMAEWTTFALYWHAPAASAVVDPIFGRPITFYLFALPVWQLVTGWLMTLAVMSCAVAIFFVVVTGGTQMLGRKRIVDIATTPWRGLSVCVAALLLVLASRVYLDRFDRLFQDQTIFAGVTYTDAHVTLTGLLVVSIALVLGAAIALANAVAKPRLPWLVASIRPRGGLLCRRGRHRLVRQQLHRQAERTGARAALYRAQHRNDPASVRPEPDRPESVPCRGRRRGAGRRRQPVDAAEHSTLGLARAAGHPAADSGNPDLLRLPGYRHRPLRVQWIDAPDDGRRARAQRREAAGEQPELDQREADLHPRLRRHDEPGQRLHAGGSADARPEQHADSEHDSGIHRDAAGAVLRRAHQHRRLRQDPAEGVQLPAGRDEQPDLVRRRRRHPARRIRAAAADCPRSRRHREAAVQRRHHTGQPSADAPEYRRTGRDAGAVPDLRPRPLRRRLG